MRSRPGAPLPDGLAGLADAEAEQIRAGCIEQADFPGSTDDVELRALTEHRCGRELVARCGPGGHLEDEPRPGAVVGPAPVRRLHDAGRSGHRRCDKVVVTTADGQEVTVAVSGGAFVATVFAERTMTDEFIRQAPPVVNALSADGTELGRTDGTSACFADPAGNVVIGTQRAGTPCGRAVPWP